MRWTRSHEAPGYWRAWFAWPPVIVEKADVKGRYVSTWVWLETVERLQWGGTHGSYYDYRSRS